MRLSDLIQGLQVQAVHGGELPRDEVRGLVYDSRRVGPGDVFAALAGVASDGHAYLEMASGKGALAALVQRPAELPLVQIQVPDTRLALSMMADRFYGRPSRHLTMVGITGTNGKTTVSYLVEALLSQRGPAGLVGTVEQRYPGKRRASSMTTPESVELQAALAEMYAAGVKGVAMEVSSHALEQHRVAGCRFDAAVFTNLSRDHLDYHGDMDSYFQAKRRLFNRLLPQSKREGKDPAAVRAGARAAVVSRWVEDLPGLCQVRVADTRAALAALADLFHGRPSDHMTLVGVTGTNGKTTVSYLVEAMLAGRGPVGVVGTVETRFAGQRQPSAMTSPQSADLQALLARMRQAGVEQAVCEISSHALDQRRAEAVAWDAAVFTNLTRDHLDYHG
ncbi:MAG: hypothetical protein KJ921_15845, partial [Proteobacteria bacterium]|nr:hypothetical protein [Pseudomonadota bacterium]